MSDDLRRAFAFMARGDIGGLRSEPTRFGTLHADDRYPLRWDSNYLAVDALPADVSANELEADAEVAQARAGFAHRSIFFRDAATAERLAPAFVARGWEVHRGLVMVLRRAPERPIDTSRVTEVAIEDLRAVRMAAMPPWGTPEVRAQMTDAKHGIAERVAVRCFAVLVDGEPVSSTDLYEGDGVAQIEDVATLSEHQGRGYASAVVTKAADEARAAGADLVFLVTDADDWPKELYGRLGFDASGSYVKVTRA
jgi:ribosomal protein S18 acetylase RimI-like enzyme